MAKTKNEAKNEVVAVETNPLFAMMGETEQTGFEGADKDSFAIPFLRVLQPTSPAIAEGVEGAKPGIFVNTVTGEIITSPKVIPCAYARRFLKWTPRSQGSNFRGEMTVVEYERAKAAGLVMMVKDEKGVDREAIDGLILTDTRSHYCLLISDDGKATPCVIALASTQIKRSKRWMTLMNERQLPGTAKVAPMFSTVYSLSTIKETNVQGTWYSIEPEVSAWVSNPSHYALAVEFSKQVGSGAVTVKHEDGDGA